MSQPITVAPLATDSALPQFWITRFEGHPLVLPWCWSAAEPSANLADLLDRSGHPPDEESRTDLACCRINATGAPGAARLAFEHSSRTLRCSLNGQWLPPGQLAWLEPGDTLEVGLCRCEVKDAEPLNARAPAHGSANAEPLPEVDLAALTARRPQNQDAPPGELMDLLGRVPELQTPQSQPGSNAAEPNVQHAQADANLAQPFGVAPQIDAPEEAEVDLQADTALRQLHDKYLRRLNSPFADPQDSAWTDLLRTGQSGSDDPFEAIKMQSKKGGSLPMLLGLNDSIHSVLSQLDTLSHGNILSPDEQPSLLHLFAPPAWRQADLHPSLPQLSRQEHHGVALDSALSTDTLALPTTGHSSDKA